MRKIIIATAISIFTLMGIVAFAQNCNELHRPQYHFTTQRNFMLAPIGIVKQNNQYHLFYQYNPNGNQEGYLHAGHATSKDLLKWKENPIALAPDNDSKDIIKCTIGKGSVIVDKQNTLQKQSGDNKTLVLFYTSKNCGQRMAYSTDAGKSWKKYENNPIIPHNVHENAKAPNVFWHKQENQYVMLLSRQTDIAEKTAGISIYTSKNLIDWKFANHIYGLSGAADLFEMTVDSTDEKKWVLTVEDGSYLVGNFNGTNFTTILPKKMMDYGMNFGYSKTFTDNNRLMQIAYMKDGKYPFMPFFGQLTFPVELSLTKDSDQYILCRKPIKEIETLYDKSYNWENKLLIPGLNKNLVRKADGDCLHIKATFDIKSSDLFGFVLRDDRKQSGTDISYDVKKGLLILAGRGVKLQPVNSKITLEILLDRSSIEVFANNGAVSITHNFQPQKKANDIKLVTRGGELLVEKLEIHRLKSIWSEE